jgi:hypothetical protein
MFVEFHSGLLVVVGGVCSAPILAWLGKKSNAMWDFEHASPVKEQAGSEHQKFFSGIPNRVCVFLTEIV